MIDVIAAATLTCAAALVLGQAACLLCGATSWTFLSAPVGFALLILICAPAIHFPGRATTVAAILGLLILGAIILLAQKPAMRPRGRDLLIAAPTAVLMTIPFIASGRVGTLGVAIDNDMATHLLWAEAIRSAAAASVASLDAVYPVGPHGLSAVLAQALDMRVDLAFAGVTMATPILIAWTALAAMRRGAWLGRTFVATMTACTFMIAAYYAEGSFKEPMLALLLLGFVIGLQQLVPGSPSKRLRWIPLALIVGGALSVYSVDGLPWFVATAVAWLMVLAARLVLSGTSPSSLALAARSAISPALLAGVALIVLVSPQLGRLARFLHRSLASGAGTGIAANNLGNLVGPVSFWKVFGMWDVADFRLPAAEPFHVGMYVTFGLLLALGGGLWTVRHREFALPLAVAIGIGIWIYSNDHQSPYVTAKALVVLAPLVMLLATRWLVELDVGESWLSTTGMLRFAAAAVLGWSALGTSVQALRTAYVGPTAHANDLRAIRPILGHSKTLFLGWDDFIQWELAGTPVQQPFYGGVQIPLVSEKHWTEGQTLEFEDIPPAVLDQYSYVVSPRSEANSTPPSNFHLLRTSRYYQVWRRQGVTPAWQTLAEGPQPGTILDCKTARGRALSRERGFAIVRRPSVEVPVTPQLPGTSVSAQLVLTPGHWSLSSPYFSPHPVEVHAPGMRVTLPANLDRPGNRWPVGALNVHTHATVTVTFHVQDPPLASPDDPTSMNTLIATPENTTHTIPLRRACGKYVEWYMPASSSWSLRR